MRHKTIFGSGGVCVCVDLLWLGGTDCVHVDVNSSFISGGGGGVSSLTQHYNAYTRVI